MRMRNKKQKKKRKRLRDQTLETKKSRDRSPYESIVDEARTEERQLVVVYQSLPISSLMPWLVRIELALIATLWVTLALLLTLLLGSATATAEPPARIESRTTGLLLRLLNTSTSLLSWLGAEASTAFVRCTRSTVWLIWCLRARA